MSDLASAVSDTSDAQQSNRDRNIPHLIEVLQILMKEDRLFNNHISKFIRGDVNGPMSHLWVLDFSWQTRLVVAEMLHCELPPHARFLTGVVVDSVVRIFLELSDQSLTFAH